MSVGTGPNSRTEQNRYLEDSSLEDEHVAQASRHRGCRSRPIPATGSPWGCFRVATLAGLLHLLASPRRALAATRPALRTERGRRLEGSKRRVIARSEPRFERWRIRRRRVGLQLRGSAEDRGPIISTLSSLALRPLLRRRVCRAQGVVPSGLRRRTRGELHSLHLGLHATVPIQLRDRGTPTGCRREADRLPPHAVSVLLPPHAVSVHVLPCVRPRVRPCGLPCGLPRPPSPREGAGARGLALRKQRGDARRRAEDGGRLSRRGESERELGIHPVPRTWRRFPCRRPCRRPRCRTRCRHR